MKHHYLIDYENVHEDGLTGLNTIEDDAVIHIFYSDRARKLDLDSFREGQILQIEALKVPVGKQSLDMQLVSYMGYLMGRERGEGNCYIIISKDNGYLNSIPFWRSVMRDGTTVEVRPQIRPSSAEETKAAKPAAREEQDSSFSSSLRVQKQPRTLRGKGTRSEAVRTDSDNFDTLEQQTAAPRQEKNDRRTRSKGRGRNRRERTPDKDFAVIDSSSEISSTETPAGETSSYESPAAASSAADTLITESSVSESPAAESSASEPFAAEISARLTTAETAAAKSFSAGKAVVSDSAKPEDSAPVKEDPHAVEPAKPEDSVTLKKAAAADKSLDRSALNTSVMQTLSKASVDAATTGKISSIVMKHASEEQNKTKIYREIIRTLGQKEGLIIYNYIKSLL